METLIIKHEPDQRPAQPLAGLPEGYDVGVRLRLRAEYGVVLPVLAHYLVQKWYTTEAVDEAQVFECRLKELDAFRHDIEGVPYNPERYFDLQPEECEEVAVLLAVGHTRPLVMREQERHQRMAIELWRCIGMGWSEVLQSELPVAAPHA
jgi:hypothetical protein